MIGGRFALLTIISSEDTNIDPMITTFNTAVTEPASEILGKHRQNKKTWITAEILNRCDKKRELRKKRFEPEGSEKYREVNNIKRCMKKAKENWIGEQRSEIEENLRKNNSKRAYQLVKDFIIIINPLTARVVGAQQMILQPVFSIFPCSPLPSGTCRTPGLSIP